MKSSNPEYNMKTNVEKRCAMLEKIAGRKGLSAEERTALLESARFQRSWADSIHRHAQSEQVRNMALSGAMLKIIGLASESLAPYCKQEWLDAWSAFKKGGSK